MTANGRRDLIRRREVKKRARRAAILREKKSAVERLRAEEPRPAVFTIHNWGDQIKEGDRDGTCSTHYRKIIV